MMRGERWKIAVATTALAALGLAGTAWGTLSSTVFYSPPVLRVSDAPAHGTIENLVFSNDADEVIITNKGYFQGVSPKSDPGCTKGGHPTVRCPSDGLGRLRVNTRDLDDQVKVKLRGPMSKLDQRVALGEGLDRGVGGRGKQRLLGGPGRDFLLGGPGPDLLDGGPGNDVCRGGPGKDVLKSC